MYLSVIDVKPLSDYQLLLTFDNSEKRLFDMKPYLDRGVYRELKDESKFSETKNQGEPKGNPTKGTVLPALFLASM